MIREEEEIHQANNKVKRWCEIWFTTKILKEKEWKKDLY